MRLANFVIRSFDIIIIIFLGGGVCHEYVNLC